MVTLMLLACQSPPEPPRWCSAQGEAFGTTWSSTWRAPSCDPTVEQGIAAALAEVDAQMSTWRDDSEINQVRRSVGPAPVSADTLMVVRHALALAQETGGAFDPTVQPLMEVWGFHTRERDRVPPNGFALLAARKRVGWQKVTLGVDPSGPWIDGGGTALDLSAIAKGHGVDRVAHSLSQRGLRHHMVEVGGEVRVMGEGPKGAWVLGVDVPEEGTVPGAQFAAILELSNVALATSGNYRNLVEVDGRKVHHTMDPRTGGPAVTDVASASVVAPDCRTADALATAVMVLGSEAGLALVEARSDVEALVLVSGADGLEQRTTSGMGSYIRAR